MGKPLTEQEKENPFVKQMLERTKLGENAKRRVVIECSMIVEWTDDIREYCGADLEMENALEIVRSRVQTVLDALEKL